MGESVTSPVSFIFFSKYILLHIGLRRKFVVFFLSFGPWALLKKTEEARKYHERERGERGERRDNFFALGYLLLRPLDIFYLGVSNLRTHGHSLSEGF